MLLLLLLLLEKTEFLSNALLYWVYELMSLAVFAGMANCWFL